MLASADLQLGLANACIEVGAGCPRACQEGQRRAAGSTPPPACCALPESHLRGTACRWHAMPSLTCPPLSIPAPIQVVNYAHMRSHANAFPWATLQLGRLHHALELWQVGAGGWGWADVVQGCCVIGLPSRGRRRAKQVRACQSPPKQAAPCCALLLYPLRRASTGCATTQKRASRSPAMRCQVGVPRDGLAAAGCRPWMRWARCVLLLAPQLSSPPLAGMPEEVGEYLAAIQVGSSGSIQAGHGLATNGQSVLHSGQMPLAAALLAATLPAGDPRHRTKRKKPKERTSSFCCSSIALARAQVRVEEELAFIDASSIFARIVATGARWHGDASSGGRGGPGEGWRGG